MPPSPPPMPCSFEWLTWAQGFFPGAILGAVATYFAGQRLEFFRRDIRLGEDHLKALKRDVLEPLLRELRDYHLPICEFKVGAVERSFLEIRDKSSSISDDGYRRVDFCLQIAKPQAASSSSSIVEERKRVEAVAILCADAKGCHYPDLFQRTESFIAAFRKAAEQHLTHANAIREILFQKIGLPAHIRSAPSPEKWASYEYLAIFVYERKMGITRDYLSIADSGTGNNQKTLKRANGPNNLLSFTSQEEVDRILKIIEELIRDTSEVEDLHRAFEHLAPKADAAADLVQRELHNNDLPKKCSLA